MRIFLVGATGALGRRLVPILVEQGHSVVGVTRTAAKADGVERLGAEPVVLDILDADATRAALEQAKPDVVIHQATALSGTFDLRRMDRFFHTTNLLRTRGTDNLIAAARAADATRLIAQGYTGWPNQRAGGAVKTETDPMDDDPPPLARQSMAALRHVETVVPAAEGLTGLVLRYGGFYGPGTSLSTGSEIVENVRRRRLPLVGSGGGVWSFVHIDDAATATVAALDRGDAGLYNIVDDDPAPVREWLPALAQALGAKPPRRIPAWLARLALGENGVRMMTEIRGSSNAKAKRELGWTPAYPSWQEGFRTGLG